MRLAAGWLMLCLLLAGVPILLRDQRLARSRNRAGLCGRCGGPLGTGCRPVALTKTASADLCAACADKAEHGGNAFIMVLCVLGGGILLLAAFKRYRAGAAGDAAAAALVGGGMLFGALVGRKML